MRTDLLKFDASSIQELLTRKLIDSGLYSDQIYPGSDTRILIDLFSWMFNVIMYNLNNSASNALFDDAELYENLNKIVKILSYKPHAYKTSYAEFNLNYLEADTNSFTCTIPKFASINTGKSDSYGNAIKYSFVKDFTFNVINGQVSSLENPVLYNGKFVHYTFYGETTGSPFEMFILQNTNPDEDEPTYIDTTGLTILFEKINDDGIKVFKEIEIVDSLVLDAGPADLSCEVRINENKDLTIRFGDNKHGKTLESGGTLHLLYLQSNADEGIIDSGEISKSEISLEIENISSITELINICYGGIDNFLINYGTIFSKNNLPLISVNNFRLSNIRNSSPVLDYESLESIKMNAPAAFRIGNRLVTGSDFRTFILSNFPNIISDVYVCNNTEYCTNFYKWLDQYNSFDIGIRLENFKYASSCDFNNVYIWLKPTYEGDITNIDKTTIIKECEKRKLLTTNLVPCQAIKSYVMPFLKYDTFDITDLNETVFSSFTPPVKIFIVKNGAKISDGQVKVNVSNVIVNYFNNNSKLGSKINLSDLLSEIYSLGYIESVKTVLSNSKSNGKFVYTEGLSFISFSESLVEYADYEIFNQSKVYEKFQYPELLNKDSFISMIEVVNDTSYIMQNREF